MKAELERTRSEKEELSRALAEKEQDENEFCEPRASTMREEQVTPNETMLAAMTNMSLSSLKIPQCVPTGGATELNKRDYEHWKKVVNASMNIYQTVDEEFKFDLIRINAGPLLLELLDDTTTQPGMPDEVLAPYSNAIARLDGYFGSRAYMLSQRNQLANMVQTKEETNIQFVKRVAMAAKLCTYKPDEEFEAISRTVTRGCSDSRVRTLAYRVLTDGGSLNELLDRVRFREVELENEKDYQRLHHPQSVAVAAVTRYADEKVQHRRDSFEPARGYNDNRFKGSGFRGSWVQPRGQRSDTSCWRCLKSNHSAEGCFHRDKVCRICNRRGHIALACSTRVKQEPRKRRWVGDEPEPPTKIAAVQKTEEDMEDEKVNETNND